MRLAMWPKLFQAEEYMGKKSYSITTQIAEKEELYKFLMDAIVDVVSRAYPGKPVEGVIKKFKGSRQSWPLKETDEEGVYTICAKRKAERGAPTVLDQLKQNIAADAGLPYGGCIVNILVTVCCYTQNAGGVTIYLEGVQLVREGEPLSGARKDCRDDFAVIESAPQGSDVEEYI